LNTDLAKRQATIKNLDDLEKKIESEIHMKKYNLKDIVESN